ncbi:uncharacterized protein LOC133986310 [Scomber scombrus]|nr:uncharacterized protein LOC133986310 [Scomber scombrus]
MSDRTMRRQVLLYSLALYVSSVLGQVSYSIPEEMPSGSLVGNIAQDLGLDIRRLKSGKARVYTGDSAGYIELNRERGLLLIKDRIDREAICRQTTPCALHFQIILESPMEFYSITVEITDINDNPPTFEKNEVSFKISESAVIGAKFALDRAIDPDVGKNGLQKYELKPTDNFVLKRNSQGDGTEKVEMVLQKPLDREKEELISLVLTAFDGGEPQMSGTIRIFITVLDVNDNAPVFSQSTYTATVLENAPEGTVVTSVSASDADHGTNGRIKYSITNSLDQAHVLFRINETNGGIRLIGKIDYETARNYHINIRASDDGGLTDSCKVIVEVVDINDNKPAINMMSKSNMISEHSKLNTVVAMMNVQDPDSNENGKVHCFISDNTPLTIVSTTNNFYSLVTDSELDRERASEYNITVTCADEGVPALSSSVTLTLQISDVNDNAPVFERSSYEAYIVENNTPGLSIFTVKARDADWNQNARVSYILEDSSVNGVPVSSYMSVSADSGVIHAVRSFDYEQIKDFQFRVKAQDGGSPPLSSNVTVKIMIQDQNDNPPQVLYPVQTGGSLVAEMVPRSADVGYLVTKVVAVDVDSGQNAWLSYKLQKATDRALFEVGLQNGEIRTIRQVTDKDAVKQRLTVIVEDNGQPSRSATVIVNVAVADSFPEVLSEFTDFTHDEDYNDNLTFYLVLALAVVSFLFITCLVVIISVKIYRWRQSRILYHSNLPVIPYYPPRYSDTLGTGTLQHVYNYEVCRTTDSRKSDCKFGRAGSQNVLIMDPSSTGTMQRIQSEKSILDEADSPLEVGYMDMSGRTMKRQVLLLISAFCLSSVIGQVSYSIPEEMAKGSLVGNIAHDLGLDVKRLKSGKARIYTGDNYQYIELNRERRVLLIKEKIDREALCRQTTPCALHFQITLENPLELFPITVEITDINDNSPVFQKEERRFEISESAVIGSKFMLEKAIDSDIGPNGLQRYTLKPSDNFMLKLHSQSDGSKKVEMVLQKPLDREKQEHMSLVLTAEDGGEPQMTGTMQIHVTVLDANDNAPVFTKPVYKASITENSVIGTLITKVSASDADKGSNGEVTYVIGDSMATVSKLFHISSEGDVILDGVVDYEKQRIYHIDIEAIDQGGLSDSSKIVIDVIDVNDNSPTVNMISTSGSVPEDSALKTVIALLSVNDPDSETNGKVHCVINENIPFEIKFTSNNFYSIVTDGDLDRERASEYNITVTCSDEGVPSLSSSVTLTLQISDVNDNAPVFERSSYEAYIVENNTPGLSIFTVRAKDADWNQNARVSYILEDSSVNGVPVSSYVSVSADSGVIHAVRSFDYEQIKDFQFRVKAQDGGSPPLSSNVTVKMMIQDQNDNPPQVLYPVQTGGSLVAEMVTRSADVGYLVTKVVAVDVDSGQNAWLSYKLQKATDRALFEVGLQNGEIRTIRQVTDKDAVKQRLTVIVEDNGQPSRSATVIVNVAVTDSFPEVLSEFTDFTHDKEYNDNLTFYLVLALAVVSFLFITCLVVIISVKIYRWRQSRILYHSNLPVIPYYPPRYSDILGTGTLQHVYNYEVCRTTDSRKSDCKFGRAGSQNVLIMDPSSTGTMQRIQSEKSILDEPDSPPEVRLKLEYPGKTMKRQVLLFILVLFLTSVFGQVSYSIPEEMEKGSLVSNVAHDLGLDLKRLKSGRARIHSGDSAEFIELNKERGVLLIKERIDREMLCGETTPCTLHLQMILENPIELFRITVEITDINDNAPSFTSSEKRFEISESAVIGSKFVLDKAVDADIGANTLQTYSLKPTNNFALQLENQADGSKKVEMVLQKPLDREQHEQLSLLLTALDGGQPRMSGTMQITVHVLDVNDNAPVFTKSVYKATITENSTRGTSVITVRASDKDSGSNGEISYAISNSQRRLSEQFQIDRKSGVVMLMGEIDYEKAKLIQIDIEAIDNGGLSDSSKILIDVIDVNDNSPQLKILSKSDSILEDSPENTVISVLSVNDPDSERNGQVKCKINDDIPFKIQNTMNGFYSLVTEISLDRELASQYNITVTCSDEGVPSLSSSVTLTLQISDVNDNAPVFERSSYEAYIVENNTPGLSIFTVKARDADWNQNARVSYILEDSSVNGVPVSSYVSVSADSGVIHAVRSFDYEQIKDFQVHVKAQDGGSPPLSSNLTVKIMIQDQNDNPPQVLYPVQTGGSLVAEMVPRSADMGYLVTKVVAVDVDSGQNAWLSYKIQKATERALFEVGLQNGEIRTIRQVTDKDAVKQRLTVIVEDNGQPSRSATVIVNVAVADSFPEVLSEFTDFTHDKEYNDNLTFYLVLALAVVSFLFVTCLVVIISVKIYRWRQSRILYHSNLPVIPYYPPRYSDTLGTGTLQHVYNYEVCRTTDSRKSDCKFGRAGSQNVLIMDPSSTGTMQRIQSEKSILDEPDSPLEFGSTEVSYRTMRRQVLLFFSVLCFSSVLGQISYSIPEEMAKGSLVGNIVQDLGVDVRRLQAGKARIHTGSSAEYIHLNKEKGLLIIKERIDREALCGQTTPCALHFQIALENPIEIFPITVEITDINDNAPVFEKEERRFEISESAVIGSKFMLEKAIDPDIGPNGLHSYTLKPNDNFILKLHSQSDGGKKVEMILQKPLDREKHEFASLLLTAVDGGEPQRSGTMQIHITVLDVNDNSPVFTQTVYKASVKENSPTGTLITKVSASDADKGSNGEVSYVIGNSMRSISKLFHITEDGDLILNGPVDYEKAKKYEIDIEAVDRGGLSDSSKVIIDIGDINDNSPVMNMISTSHSIGEDSRSNTVVAVMSVNDPDSEENGKIRCAMCKNIPFIITSSSSNLYSIVTDSDLDRERSTEYNITVTCSDEGVPSLSSSVTLTLQISDVNDNAPVFERSSYEAYIVENNTPGLSIFTVKAKDADWNQNARVSYILEDSSVNGVPVSSYVSVSADSGVIHAVRSFDYEQIKDFQFRVKAQDGGSPPLSSNVTVKIMIQDQNDNPPQVLYPVQTGGSLVAEMVPRSADVGYLVTKVVAVDMDSGQNAWLSYKLQKATDRALFEVGSQNGEIRTIRQVTDKDAVKQRLTVIVEDNGQPSRSATVIVNVVVADSFPEVLSEFTDFTHDKEYNDNLTFYLVLALAVVSFLFITCLVVIISVKIYRWRQSRIMYHSNLPVIPYYPPRYSDTLGTGTLQHVYNYEVCMTTDSRKSDCKFGRAGSQNVLIMDPSSTGTMQRIQSEKSILDEPDSPLEMRRQVLLCITFLSLSSVLGQVSYSVPEEMEKGSLVGNIAQDLGLDVKRLRLGNARVYSGDSKEYIELNSQRGVLLIKEKIDRETLCGDTMPCAVHFQIVLEIPMEFYSVTVEITDINDNAPTFEKNEMKFTISESAVVGAKFDLERAADLDVGTNTLQSYVLKPTDNFLLKLHSQTDGTKNVEMVLQKPLDREKNEFISLVLTAVDGGEPQMSGTMQILITVLDANDNAPVFTQPIYKGTIDENALKGTTVTTVSASDADQGLNGKIMYSITNTLDDVRHMFEVDEDNGEVRLIGRLDYEKKKHFQINVRARDNGGLTDSCKVIVDVVDINDNEPAIKIMSKSAVISESASPNTVVTMINIQDPDSGENGKVQCFISDNIPFVLKSSSNNFYSLVTDSDLDREKSSEYNITVTCSDEGVPSLSSSVTLTLQISDVNDNAPVFERSAYEAYIVENNTPGLSIFTVKARDADWNQNARVSYILEDSSVNGVPVSSYVSVSADSGVIHAIRSFDYEQIKDFQFRVKAQDGGSPPLSSNVTVKIMIQDQNDNPPQVLYPVQTGGSVVAEMVPRSADVGYLVTKVVAVDVDSGQNAWLSYKLQKATDRALFEVGLQNGEIRTIRQVTDKDAVKQRLTVIVEDNGQPSRSATVIVNVAVADSFPDVLSEFTDFTHDKEYNDNLTFYLVLALAVVSFLFITCLVVIISVKIYRWRQSRILYHSNLPVIPYYPPRYSDTLGTGTLQHVYNYEVCRTTDSRKSDCKFGRAGSQNVLIMDPSSTGTMQRIQSEKSILDEPDSPLEVGYLGLISVVK